MEYIGEHTLPGQFGNFFVALGFASAVLAVVATFLSLRKSNTPELSAGWGKLGTNAFLASAISSFVFIGIMFYLLVVQYFEYEYVWEQSNSKMSFKYILVCFWGGQQGSFMLWLFWHSVLGLFMLRAKKEYRFAIIFVFALIQSFLISMMLGIYIGETKIGMNPFMMLRDKEGLGFLWRQIPDYLQLDPTFKDGKGLNPLLQNYWMVIHPPTLFLGFTSVTIPFAYAIAALWKKDYSGWLKPVLPWTFFSVAILALGILMGGAWAYESLSFGGFWAWDPVENASFVPWLTLVGAAHLMLVNKHNQKSLYSAFFLTLLSYVLVLYSSFLTRSGILGDSSVHSFTGGDIFNQLLIFFVFFVWFSFMMLLVNKRQKLIYSAACLLMLIVAIMVQRDEVIVEQGSFKLSWAGLIALVYIVLTIQMLIVDYLKHFPKADKEEELWTREFWMFIGSIVLVLSALFIVFNTSLEVINHLFKTNLNLIEAEERNWFYNTWQTPFAIVICILVGATQFYKYKTGNFTEFRKKIMLPFIASLVITIPLAYFVRLTGWNYDLLLFASVFSITANFDHWMRMLKGKLNHAGSPIAHIGFGMIMLGALLSQNKQQVISQNYKGYNLSGLDKDMDNKEDVQLFRNDTTAMGEYFICYKGKTKEGPNQYYEIEYFSQQPANYKKGTFIDFSGLIYQCRTDHTSTGTFQGDVSNWELISAPTKSQFLHAGPWLNVEAGNSLFTLTPFVQLNEMSNVSEPGTKRYITHDIFTHIKYADLNPVNDNKMELFSIDAKAGDTIPSAGFVLSVLKAEEVADSLNPLYELDSVYDITILDIVIHDRRDINFKYPCIVNPVFVEKEDGTFANFSDTIPELGLLVELKTIKQGLDTISIKDTANANRLLKNYSSLVITDTLKMTGQIIVENNKKTKYDLSISTREFIVLHAIRFPFINILWIGCIVMFIGTIMAVVYRLKLK